MCRVEKDHSQNKDAQTDLNKWKIIHILPHQQIQLADQKQTKKVYREREKRAKQTETHVGETPELTNSTMQQLIKEN